MKTMHVSWTINTSCKKLSHLDELSDTLKPFSYRVLKEDCLDLPDKVYINETYLLSQNKRKFTKQMKEAVAVMNGKQVNLLQY